MLQSAICDTNRPRANMKTTDVSWRTRIGRFSRGCPSPGRGVNCQDVEACLLRIIAGATVFALLIIGGVKINPGPVSVSIIIILLAPLLLGSLNPLRVSTVHHLSPHPPLNPPPILAVPPTFSCFPFISLSFDPH